MILEEIMDFQNNTYMQSSTTDLSTELSQLDFLRRLIDNIDSAILSILAHRGQVISLIVEYKAIHHIAPVQSQVRKNIVKDLIEFSTQLQLNPIFVRQILNHLFKIGSSLIQLTPQSTQPAFFLQQKDILPNLNRTLKNFDQAFCSLLAERMQLVEQVGIFKQEHRIAPLAKSRWVAVLQSKIAIAKSLHINPVVIRKLYTLIHKEALRIESSVACSVA